jgi:hypothetical protein
MHVMGALHPSGPAAAVPLNRGPIGGNCYAVSSSPNDGKRLEDEQVEDPSISNKRLKLSTVDPQDQGLAIMPRSVPPTGRSYVLSIEEDVRNLSQYQCLARQQIEVFEATAEDANTNAQGRNRPVLIGQVGIRCRHCYKLPPRQRKTGSVYYPNRVRPCECVLRLFVCLLVFIRAHSVTGPWWCSQWCLTISSLLCMY